MPSLIRPERPRWPPAMERKKHSMSDGMEQTRKRRHGNGTHLWEYIKWNSIMELQEWNPWVKCHPPTPHPLR